ncbi:GNAT family N-acetyltransferase [Aegicerativicinus sediminis]|uniref:GNAT family N-acetyltransferase n=1 Tax=Aegicerativicinus sediminis TaxID=2893202 RepID=UPI001E59F242|nr:GNAT family N-acetyltransferase [Aegicerativicinus sediminis]
MEFSIRQGNKGDMPAVLSLIKDLAIFEKEPDAVVVTLEDLERDGFSDNPLYKCWVAEVGGKVIGLALVYDRYSTWKGRAIHLEDLIVKQEYRGNGIGSALLDTVVSYGHNEKVRRISWEVLDWNTPAIELYKKKGGRILEEWRVVQLDEKGIEVYLDSIRNESL